MTGMALRISKKSLPVILFGVMLAVLAGPVVPATLNYLEFYPSLSRIETTILEASWVGAPSSVKILTKIELISRGEYRGFSLVNLGGQVHFALNGMSYSIGGAGVVNPTLLLPGQPVQVDLRLSSSGDLADLFVQWAESQPKPVWTVDLSYDIKTFFSERPMAMTYLCNYPGACTATVGHIPSPPVGGE